MAQVTLKPISKKRMTFGIVGTSPLIQHKWAEKAKQEMRDKQQGGKKTKARELRNPETEAKAATYVTDEGKIGIPGLAFKTALLSAAHKDIGIEKTLVRKAIFLVTNDSERVLPITGSDPVVREDMVRVGMGSADLRYRPEFREWKCLIELEVDGELLQLQDVLSLVDRAGFGIGICEWRPEKGGEFGRFKIDSDVPVTWDDV
jgi:hypothetical protein